MCLVTQEFTLQSLLDYLYNYKENKEKLEPYITAYIDFLKKYDDIEELRISEKREYIYKQTELVEKLLLRI